MEREELLGRIEQMAEEDYGAFQRRLLPNLAPERIMGVRTPALRELAKEVARQPWAGAFCRELPHGYFEENQLQAFLLSQERDYHTCMAGVEAFLPYVDNWATCDQLSPKAFKKNREDLLTHVRVWLESDYPFTVRFGIRMLMDHYLDQDFSPEYLGLVAGVDSEEYYVRMMVAWYFATALAKQWEAALPFVEEGRLAEWTWKKTIQKAIESYRISPEQKDYLRNLRSLGAPVDRNKGLS